MAEIRPIAFVLPQFHPIPENDEWWGKGFTEWTNVTKAEPLFKEHYQPRLPTDLGFYDLRLPQAREAQASLAKKYGIEGFCYYHYWFNGKRLLNEPLDEIIRLQQPEMPFMLCWANENWTRTWDGEEKNILIEQEYSEEDDIKHMRWLCENIFNDGRYITVDKKPVFAVYRFDLFPDISRTSKLWRKIAKEEFGFKDLYLCTVQSFRKKIDPASIGFDAAIEFSPHQVAFHPFKPKLLDKVIGRSVVGNSGSPQLVDFKAGVAENLQNSANYKLYKSVTPGWDNTPRKNKNGIVAVGSSPKVFYKWIKKIVDKFSPYSQEENFLFINAMNEWAEGNHLEPCRKYGRQYLEAVKKALKHSKK